MHSSQIKAFVGACCLLAINKATAQCNEFATLVPEGDPIATYGESIAVDGEWAVIGAGQDYDNNTGTHEHFSIVGYKTGAIFIRHFDNGEWVPTQKIRCPNRNPFGGDEFGSSIALQGDTLLIGAPGHELSDGHLGAVFVYERTGDTWELVDQLDAQEDGGHESFGWTVALDGDIAAIGAIGVHNNQGAVLVYERVAGVWSKVAKLQGSGSDTNDRIGSAVTVKGETILAGARNVSNDWGSAWIFERVNDEWTESAHLSPSDPSSGSQFGYAVCLDGDEALVGGKMDDLGKVYVFARHFGIWDEQETYAFSATNVFDTHPAFGRNIAVEGDLAIISAPNAKQQIPGSNGAAYIFYRQSEVWTQGPRLMPEPTGDSDDFSRSLTLVDGTVYVQDSLRQFEGTASRVLLFDPHSCRPSLEVMASCPDGGPLRIDWSNATPNGIVTILFSAGSGQTAIPPGHHCEGVMLDLDPQTLIVIYSDTAGADGSRSLHVKSGNTVCGGYMQLLDATNCTTSSAVHIESK